ncbi:MAG: hypothetical protein ABIH23_14425 [bacterium]
MIDANDALIAFCVVLGIAFAWTFIGFPLIYYGLQNIAKEINGLREDLKVLLIGR